MITFGLLVAGSLFVAWRTDAAAGAVGAAAGLVFIVFAEWAIRANPDMLVLPGGPLPGIGPIATDGSVSLHLISAAIFAAGFGVAGFLAQGRSPARSFRWSGRRAVFTPLALLVALYARIAHLDRSIPFAILAVMLAAAFAAATEILSKREDRPGLQASIALFATGTLAALALALTFALEKGWLTDCAGADVGRHRLDLDAAADPVPALAGRDPRRASWCCGSATSRASSAAPSAPRRSSTGCCGATACRRCRSGPAASSCAAAATTRRCAWSNGRDPVHGAAGVHGNPPCRQSMATSIARAPASPRSRCRSASRWRWRSGWSACASAPAASFTMPARSC